MYKRKLAAFIDDSPLKPRYCTPNQIQNREI